MIKKHTALLRIVFVSSLVTTLFLPQTTPAQVNNQIVIQIPDEENYPLFKQSSYVDNEHTAPVIATFNADVNAMQIFLTKIFEQWKLSYQVANKIPYTIRTDWFLWHYDKDSKKSRSEPENSFFSLNTQDKYRFEIALTPTENQQTKLTFTHVWREQEKDITADSEMIWLKYRPIKPNTHAVNDFIKKIQTAFEKSNINVPYKTTAANISTAVSATALVHAAHHTSSINSTLNNVLELDSSVQTAWLNLIQKLDEKDISLSSVNTKMHRIQTQDLGITYTPDFKTIKLNPKETSKHQFKILVLPGPTNKKATIVIYHVNQSLQANNQEIAAVFLKYLELK